MSGINISMQLPGEGCYVRDFKCKQSPHVCIGDRMPRIVSPGETCPETYPETGKKKFFDLLALGKWVSWEI